MKFVQIKLFNDAGKKWSKRLEFCFMTVTLALALKVTIASRSSGGSSAGGG
jgi:hypothetical protein